MLNGIIAKANGRDKVIDFRDGLVLADIDDYAMIHGVGGKHHTMNSVIKIGLCDYTAGTGSKSKTVFASITPDICEQLFEVCKQNLGTTVYDNSFPALKEQRTANRKMMKFADMGVDVLMKVVTILTRATTAADKGTAPSAVEVAKGLNKLLSKTQERVMAKENYEDPACLTTLRRVDFQYTQDRVHSKKMGADGYAPVQRLQIFHQTYRKDGNLSNYPWTVKITNCEAKVFTKNTGATTFDSSSMRNTSDAFIQISDADMFRMMYRVTHYIAVWEYTQGTMLVMNGLDKRKKELEEARAIKKAADEAAQRAEEG